MTERIIEEFYENFLSWNDRISSVIGSNHSVLDPNILERNPQIGRAHV